MVKLDDEERAMDMLQNTELQLPFNILKQRNFPNLGKPAFVGSSHCLCCTTSKRIHVSQRNVSCYENFIHFIFMVALLTVKFVKISACTVCLPGSNIYCKT